MEYSIFGINGPIVKIIGKTELFLHETVYVGNDRLVGEVTSVTEEQTVLQVYEETSGLRPGEPVCGTGNALCATLGPGLISGIYDGICRPLTEIKEKSGAYIGRGIEVPTILLEKKWNVKLCVKPGDKLTEGMIFGTCPETPSVEHRFLVPAGCDGVVVSVVPDGEYTVTDTLVTVATDIDGDGSVDMPGQGGVGNEASLKKLTMMTKWPVRKPRRTAQRLEPTVPLITGQRVIDSLFPVAKGGAAAIPGGFGTGKTMLQHQLAKWSDADIIVYIGCGERGNEMTQVLEEFSELVDPKNGHSMLDRTILIANTSNMPVAAREASIYTGVTLAEYYRDMGYDVAVMADSTSRWAEALREISGRLEEMPAEEGFPAYLPSRLSAFYERAGFYDTLCGKKGSVTIIGAVSPQGNDFSEPVTQNTKRFIRCFWALDKPLAYARHYPAINWNTSYSEYSSGLDTWFKNEVSPEFASCRGELRRILGEEASLMDIVKLIGADLLADEQKLILDIARLIRTGFLQQSAVVAKDSYATLEKQLCMMKAIVHLYEGAKKLVAKQIPVSQIRESGIYEDVSRMKFDIGNDEGDKFEALYNKIDSVLAEVDERYRL